MQMPQAAAVMKSCDAARSKEKKVGVQVTYSLELAQLYMWAQTDEYVFLAVHVPTGEDWQ